MSTAAPTGALPRAPVDPKPQRGGEQTALLILIGIPFIALLVAAPFTRAAQARARRGDRLRALPRLITDTGPRYQRGRTPTPAPPRVRANK